MSDTVDTMMMTGKTLRVLLPDGIGYVEIRTGNVQGQSGLPVVAIEPVSYAMHEPALDGHLYWPHAKFDGTAVYLKAVPRDEDS